MERNFATLWESIADAIGDEEAVVQGPVRRTWREFDDRAARFAGALATAGIGPGAKVGQLLHNCPEFLDTWFGALKARAIPFNVNFRYTADEVRFLLDNADAEVLVFHSSVADVVAAVLERGAGLKLVVEVDDGGEHVDGGAALEGLLAASEPAPRVERSADDVTMLYTGGTTGMPKGVVAPVGPLLEVQLRMVPPLVGHAPVSDPAEVAALARRARADGTPTAVLPAPPLMHATALNLGALPALSVGGTVALLARRTFDPAEVWDTVEREAVFALTVVGDAFARPLLAELRDGPPRDVGSLRVVTSSGAMFSGEVKAGLLERLAPGAAVLDFIGATEGVMGLSVATREAPAVTGRFTPDPGVVVIGDDGAPVRPGSGAPGVIALPAIAEGYYKDEARTAATFRELDGRRYVVPGDVATVEANGDLVLLGRGSSCINTGGEKVFPEEVEEVLKEHPAVEDALVFGVPDERFGQRVVAVASAARDASETAEEVLAEARTKLAAYKLPRTVRMVDTVPRTAVGKPDYEAARRLFAAAAPA